LFLWTTGVWGDAEDITEDKAARQKDRICSSSGVGTIKLSTSNAESLLGYRVDGGASLNEK
jgi:hypothetical protein